jgi:hypothetical protein
MYLYTYRSVMGHINSRLRGYNEGDYRTYDQDIVRVKCAYDNV